MDSFDGLFTNEYGIINKLFQNYAKITLKLEIKTF